MHQQRRLSPAPSSPCPRMRVNEHQSNRMQFLQVVKQSGQQSVQPIVLKTEELRPTLNHQSREKENINGVRLISQHETPQHSQRQVQTLQQFPVGQFNVINKDPLQILREEMLRMFDFQRKDNETIKQEFELYKQELNEIKIQNSKLIQENDELKKQKEQQIQINQQQRIEIDTQWKQLRQQKEQLDNQNQLFQNFQTETLEEIKQIQQYLQDLLKDQQSQSQQTQQINLDTYDTYIKKYEQFNKQVNDYLLNRKLPEQLTEKKEQSPIKEEITMTRADMDRYKMSIIQENDNEEDEIIYQVDENGYVLNQDGNHLVDNFGRLIQLSEKDIEYFRSKNQLDEIK